jgi:hypothetical protein
MSVTGSASSTDNLKVLKGKIASLSPYAVDPTLSVEGSAADAKAVGDALDKKINHTSIADNLNTNDSDMVLSAKQGTVLKKSVDDLRVDTEESIGNIEQTLTNQGASVKNAQESADNAVELAEKKIDRDGTSAMEANFDMGSHNIVNLAEPVEETDAANKKFVEDTVKFKTVFATLKATDWYSTTDTAPYMQEITVEGLTDGVKAKVYAAFEGDSAKDKPVITACGYVSTAIRGDGKIIFTCFNKRPGTDIPVVVELYHGDTNDGECITISSPFCSDDKLSMKLLWSNGNVSNAFPEQTISVDLSEYDGFFVEYKALLTGQIWVTSAYCFINNSQYYTSYIRDNGQHVKRAVSATNEGFKFGNSFSVDESVNTYMIPNKIYGVKGVLL